MITIENLVRDIALTEDRPMDAVRVDVNSTVLQLVDVDGWDEVFAGPAIQLRNASGRVIGWDYELTPKAGMFVLRQTPNA